MPTEETEKSAGAGSACSDATLLRRYAEAGSETAFAELRQRYVRLVYATCLRETQNRMLAEDAAQGVFLLLSQKAHTLKRHETIAGWLYTASCFVSRNLMKSERRRQQNEVNAMGSAVPASKNALWESIEPHFHAALNTLRPADREAILLRFVQSHSLAEVGQRLGISENTARMRISRAIEKVRRHLAKGGVMVTGAVLTTLLAEKSSEAAPASLLSAWFSAGGTQCPAAVTLVVRQTAQDIARRSLLHFLTGASALMTLTVGLIWYGANRMQEVSAAERRTLFAAAAGNWKGTLEYADDGTKQHFTYPTSVTFESLNNGEVLQTTATYTGASNVDITTFRYQPQSGKFEVTNGGSQRSHLLAGACNLIRQADGEYIFEGSDPAQAREIRIRLSVTPSLLAMQEEYRLPGQAAYTFRNRFTLKR